MQNTNFTLPQTVVGNGTQTGTGFTNPSNLLYKDGVLASSASGIGQASDVTLGNFNINLPQDAIVTGIEILLTAQRGGQNVPPITVTPILIADGLPYAGTPFAGLTTQLDDHILGGQNDVFGNSWTPDEINNVQLRLVSNGAIQGDTAQIRVYYYVYSVSPQPLPGAGCEDCNSTIQAQPFKLARTVRATDTTFILDSFNLPDSTPIDLVTMLGACGGELDIVFDKGKPKVPGGTFEENAVIKTSEASVMNLPNGQVEINLGSITNRGLKFTTPYSHDPNLLSDHIVGTEVIITANARYQNRFLQKCHIGVLVSGIIEVKENGAIVTNAVEGFNFTGSGVTVDTDPLNPNKVIVDIPGLGNTIPVVANVTPATSNTTPVSELEWMHTSSGLDRLLRVLISYDSAVNITAVEYDGNPLVFNQDVTINDITLAEYILIAPPAGTYEVRVEFDNPSVVSGIAETWVATDQVAPIGSLATSTGNDNNPVIGIPTTLSNSTIADGIATAISPILYSVNIPQQIINATITSPLTARQVGSSYQKTGVAPDFIAMDWQITQSTDWVHLATEIKGIQTTIADQFVKARATDTTASYLDDKIELTPASGNVTITKTILNSGGNEKIRYAIDSSGGGGGGAGGSLLYDAWDDFLSGETVSTYVSALRWAGYSDSPSTPWVDQRQSPVGHYGVARLGSANVGNKYIYLGGNIANTEFPIPNSMRDGNMYTAIISPVFIANNFFAAFRITSNPGGPGPANNSINFEFNENTGDMFFRTRDGSTTESTNLGAYTLNDWYEIKFEISGSSVLCYLGINGATPTLVATHSTNVPVVNTLSTVEFFTGDVSTFLDIDFFGMKYGRELSGSGSGVQTKTVSISSSEIKTLNATPKEIIAAPGAGKAIIPMGITYSFTYGTTQYTSGNDIRTSFSTTTGDALDAGIGAAQINAASNSITNCSQPFGNDDNIVENDSIILRNIGTEYATGDGTLKVFMTYKVINL